MVLKYVRALFHCRKGEITVGKGYITKSNYVSLSHNIVIV